jgi:hypothetical protein
LKKHLGKKQTNAAVLNTLRTGIKSANPNQICLFSNDKILTRIKRKSARTKDSCVPKGCPH